MKYNGGGIMKFDILKIMRKFLLVSFMFGASSIVFNNVVYAASKPSVSAAKVTDAEAAVIKKVQSLISNEYNAWLSLNKNATDAQKTAKNQEIVTKIYNNLSNSEKKLVDLYLKKMIPKIKGNKSNKKKAAKSAKAKKTAKSAKARKAAKSAKAKTGDMTSMLLLESTLLGFFSTCISYRKKNI